MPSIPAAPPAIAGGRDAGNAVRLEMPSIPGNPARHSRPGPTSEEPRAAAARVLVPRYRPGMMDGTRRAATGAAGAAGPARSPDPMETVRR